VVGYHSEPIQFVNKYYFHAKTPGSESYDNLAIVLCVVALLPLAMLFILGYIGSSFILLHKINKLSLFCPLIELEYESPINLNPIKFKWKLKLFGPNDKLTKEGIKKLTTSHRFSVITLFSVLTIVLLTFNLTAGVNFIQYGNKILENDAIPILHLTTSVIALIVIGTVQVWVISVNKRAYKQKKPTEAELRAEQGTQPEQADETNHRAEQGTQIQQEVEAQQAAEGEQAAETRKLLIKQSRCNNPENLSAMASVPLLLFISYLACYFLPFMILAFIVDPLQTTFTYILLTMVLSFLYLFLLAVSNAWPQVSPRITCSLVFFGPLAITFSISYFVFALFTVLSLGSFNDYQEIQNVIIPIIIGLITYFVMRKLKTTKKKEEDLPPPFPPLCHSHIHTFNPLYVN